MGVGPGWEVAGGLRQGAGVLGGGWAEGQQQAGGWSACEALLVVGEVVLRAPSKGGGLLFWDTSFLSQTPSSVWFGSH